MALTSEEIKKLKSLPDSPTKRLMMQAAGIEVEPEAAFNLPSASGTANAGLDAANDIAESTYAPTLVDSSGAAAATTAALNKVPIETGAIKPKKQQLSAGMADNPGPFGPSALVGNPKAGEKLQGPSTANDLYGFSGKAGESATATASGNAVESAMSGKAPAKKDDAVGHYWKDTSEIQGPSTAPYKFNLPGAPGESATGNAASKAMATAAEASAPVTEGPIPKTPEGLYDVDRLVAEGKLKPETAAAYKASKLGRPGAPVGRGEMSAPIKNPLAVPQSTGGSWMDRVNSKYSGASYDEEGNSVTVGPVTQVKPNVSIGSVSSGGGSDLDKMTMPEIEQLKAKHPNLADYLDRYIKQRAAKSTVRELSAPTIPKPGIEKMPSADTLHGAGKKYTEEHPTYEEV